MKALQKIVDEIGVMQNRSMQRVLLNICLLHRNIFGLKWSNRLQSHEQKRKYNMGNYFSLFDDILKSAKQTKHTKKQQTVELKTSSYFEAGWKIVGTNICVSVCPQRYNSLLRIDASHVVGANRCIRVNEPLLHKCLAHRIDTFGFADEPTKPLTILKFKNYRHIIGSYLIDYLLLKLDGKLQHQSLQNYTNYINLDIIYTFSMSC